MKLKMKMSVNHDNKFYPKGETHDVAEKDAKVFLEKGWAEGSGSASADAKNESPSETKKPVGKKG